MKASSQLHFFSRVYLKTPNVPGQQVFSRCAASFFLEIRQYSCGKCLSQRKNPSLPVTSCVFRYTLKNQRGPSFFQKGPRLLLSGISLLSLCAFAYSPAGVFLNQREAAERLRQAAARSEGLPADPYCIFLLACRGRCPHRPGRMHRFYGNIRRICNFLTGRQSRRPLQQPSLSPVGADDSVRPQNVPILRKSSANSLLPSGSMWASAPTTKYAGIYEFAEDFR